MVRAGSTKPYSITEDVSTYFCTDVIVGWQYVFTSPEFYQIIIDSLKHCQKEKGLNVHGYVIMPNHVHTILSAKNDNLSDIIRDYKRFTSRRISEALESIARRKLTRYFSVVARMVGARGDGANGWPARGIHPR